MTNNMQRPGASQFVALEVSLEMLASLRDVITVIRRQEVELGKQITRSSLSVVANLGEGKRREGKDRLHHFRVAAGSAEETRVHLRAALAMGWVTSPQIAEPMGLLDRVLAMAWRLTHRR
jgi:four helix bundle protein